ncbi:MAG: hypothetical protein IH624_16460 [Phycisphaerae bacterium]|nr:hypothetical protein [Phycisphaerae bacterium]
MKRLMCLLVALLVAPAMATVTISVVDNGNLTADIVVVADGDDADANGSLIAGIALDVSVDKGVISDVFNYKTTGESVVADKGYGIFLGTITFTGGTPEEIANTGTPVAPASAPDMPGQIGSSAIVLELGALYDQATPEAAPDGTTVLCTIAVSEGCNVTLGANATRGGVVRIGGGAVAPVINNPFVIAQGGPPEWNYPCFTSGDSNGDCQISFEDVQAVIAAWPPNAYAANADFNKDGGISFEDVQVLIMHWPPNPGCDVSCVAIP